MIVQQACQMHSAADGQENQVYNEIGPADWETKLSLIYGRKQECFSKSTLYISKLNLPIKSKLGYLYPLKDM